jgi:hypothetical protein
MRMEAPKGPQNKALKLTKRGILFGGRATRAIFIKSRFAA